MAVKGGRQFPVENPILVNLSLCTKTGMECFVNLLNVFNPDILGKETVEGFQKGQNIEGTMGLEMSYLSQGMDPGIGSAGGNQSHRLSRDLRELPFDGSLNSLNVWLNLPAVIVRPVIFNSQFNISHAPF
jgi:hypothetical protein